MRDGVHAADMPLEFDLLDWATIEPHYARLEAEPLTESSVGAWLAGWSALAEALSEAASRSSIEYTQQTDDEERRDAYFRYVREIAPRRNRAEDVLIRKLLAAVDDWGGDLPDDLGLELDTAMREFRGRAELFREENVSLLAEDRASSARYGEIMGALQVEFEGEPRTLAQLRPFLAVNDRARREAAWRASAQTALSARERLDELFDQLVELRGRTARNAGMDDYRDYRWRALGRFDYTPDDVSRLRLAIVETVVPARRRLARHRADALGLTVLRPWDTEVDINGDEPLAPFTGGAELVEGGARVLGNVGAVFGDRLQAMWTGGLLDLENRPGKAPGGYCASLDVQRLPFIFMNAVGTDDDVRTLLHEAGHAFHVYETANLPLIWQRGSPMEFAEVASMSMELLAAPYLDRASGGFYDGADAVRARLALLEGIIDFLPYMATVDHFQEWVYAEPDHDRRARDERWGELFELYCGGLDWSGLEDVHATGWQRKLHIFQVPFYYIEYGIAQLGALQVWRNALQDPRTAIAEYRSALALGGTRKLPDLFEAAGARLAFDAETVGVLVELIESEADRLRGTLQRANRQLEPQVEPEASLTNGDGR